MPTPHDPVCHASPVCSGIIGADQLTVIWDGVYPTTVPPGYERFDTQCDDGLISGIQSWIDTSDFFARITEAINNEGLYDVRTIALFWNQTGGISGGYPPGLHVLSDSTGTINNTCFSQLGSDCNILHYSIDGPPFYCSGSGPSPGTVGGYWAPVETLQCDFGCMTRDGECCTCFGGTWDPLTQWCYDDPCDRCYCAATGFCMNCTDPYCKAQLNCVFNKDVCTWVCDPPPNCGANYHWDNFQCLCVPCPTGECWCEKNGRCIPCTEPPCADVLDCQWDKQTCQWLCNPPDCDPGYAFYEPDCECVPDCGPGQCWCIDPYLYTGECVSCTPPPCSVALNCYWDTHACDWVCDDPDEICGPNGEWVGEPICGCDGTLSCHLRDTNGQYVLVYVATDGMLKTKRYDADDAEEETVEIDDDTSCGDPSCWLIDGVIVVLYRREHSPKLAISRTHAREWTVYEVPGDYSRLTGVEHRNRIVIMGFRAGAWYQRVGKVPLEGDVEWSDEVDSLVEDSLPTPAAPTGNGHFRDPVDNVLSFAWENVDGEWTISICRAIDLNAFGEWT